MTTNFMRINADRFLSDFAALRRIGATSDGAINRPTFSDAHLQARVWFRKKAENAGLSFHVDPAGNHSARLACADPEAPTLLIGSHLDSVYNGGGFDGALGVMTGLEVVRIVREKNLKLPFNLEAIDFTDEEGTLIGMLGSKALSGSFTPGMLEQGVASRETILKAMARAGLDPSKIVDARRDPATIHGYLELHVEQGPRLFRESIQIGVVSGIVGLGVMRVIYKGKANHAGTTSMHERQDAGLGASSLHLALTELVIKQYPGCVVTVGQIKYEPGGVHIIPGEALLSLDFRSLDRGQLDLLEQDIIRLMHLQADQFALEVSFQKLVGPEPAMMDSAYQDAIEAAAENLNLSRIRMPSGAGHDAQSLAAVCPCGMVFVPSRDGISHSPFEYTSDEDCVNGANTVLHSVLNLAGV